MSQTGGSGSSGADTARLKSLISRRAQIKAKCTRFSSYLEGLDVPNTSVVELRQRLQRFSETWDNSNEIQAAIEEIQEQAEEAINDEEERTSFEERYFAILSRLETLIERKLRATQAPHPNGPPRVHREETPITFGSIPSNEHLKLRRVNLPTFSGEARDVIGSLEVSEENYIEAWEMLKERYNDLGFIIHNHIKALFEIPVIVKENHVLLRRLLDTVLKHLRALKALKRATEYWDDLMVHLISSRLDQKTSRAWEVTVQRGQVPTLKQLTDFLAQHTKALKAAVRNAKAGISNQEKSGQARSTTANIATLSNKCAYCGKDQHTIYKCSGYLQLDIDKRIKEARARKLCLNCLRSTSHLARQCTMKSCRKCSKPHNTLLHLEQTNTAKSESVSEDTDETGNEKVVSASVSHVSVKASKQVLLATAVVKVIDAKGKAVHCRALLDSGSQSCFIASDCAKELGLKQFDTNIPVCGLGQMVTQTRKKVKIRLRSRINDFEANLDCLIINRITQALPINRIAADEVEVPEGVQLADPEFYKSSKIDMLLGAEIFFALICKGRIKTSCAQPIWQETVLGWIVAGNLVTAELKQRKAVCGLIVNEQLSIDLAKFWQIESSERQATRSPEERMCEEHFRRTYKRDDEGRFIVVLPTKEDQLRRLGESRGLAIQRLKRMEKKFERQPQLKEEYKGFMQEYKDLKHMKEVIEDSPEWNAQPQYYLPHHCVIKEESVTTRLRVVFDASAKSSSGVSLNDALMIGPVLQQDLFSILLRFRRFKYVITADIAKMYRQIHIADEQTALQRIVWRDNPSEEIKTYELATLTYGTAPASFLATKAIHQLAELEEARFPEGSRIARRDFYMDDLITVADSVDKASIICDQVSALLQKGGFVLRKWRSNSEELLKNVPEHVTDKTILNLDKEGTTKTLGVKWCRTGDVFQYTIRLQWPIVYTKRTMLASIAKIFDPLGLLAPVIATAKMWMQELWKLQVKWDKVLPEDISNRWINYIKNLQQFNNFCAPRQVRGDDLESEVQLHGFCDASERAYGACVYMRSFNKDRSIQISLLCAKSRVAPIKTISIPRLELCGAQLLAQLANKVKNSLEMRIDQIYYWTDSSVVLHWIKATNKKLPVFVAHRVGEIQELTRYEDWSHMGTKNNPADLVSRGCTPKKLYNSQLWWNGPAWLKDQAQIEEHSKIEYKENSSSSSQEDQIALTITEQPKNSFINRFSKLTRLIRVTATCIKFVQLCKKKKGVKGSQDFTLEELKQAKQRLIWMEQRSAFEAEIRTLQTMKPLPKNSSLKHLNPWLDSESLVRVGGRLRYADLQHDIKYPLVLPQRSKLTELIILHEHTRHCHAGAEATLAAVWQLYWPIRARGTVKKLIHQCLRCFRLRPRRSEQIMGDLPVYRITPARPFTNTGVDFCGPIYIREGRRRGAKQIKAYVAVFICMAVKAVHLEVVSDMTTDAFLNAFKRFISRRGRPANMYSDNGTNFAGASRELERCRELFSLDQQRSKIIDHSPSEGIKWHFIPARAPHFGELWEAAVKCFKNYFYKAAAEVTMTFKEASTLVSQIEAILNSRPLTSLSDDPNDLHFLAPGHFLIGDTLTSYPESDLLEAKLNRLSRWQMVERVRQHFWRRWSTEYLLTLQRRSKWLKDVGPPIKTGQLVVCREEGLPPLKWVLGRVQTVLPGADGIVCAAIIKMANGEYKRPAAKLCVLPVEDGSKDKTL